LYGDSVCHEALAFNHQGVYVVPQISSAGSAVRNKAHEDPLNHPIPSSWFALLFSPLRILFSPHGEHFPVSEGRSAS